MKQLITLILGLFFITSIQGQSGSIKGKIQDQNTTAIEFANILLVKPADSSLIKGVISDLDGSFIFDDLQPGNYLIKASMIGYSDSYSEIINSNNNEIAVDPIIITEGIELEGVTVSAKKPFIELKADKVVVNVENSTVNAGNSAIEILEKSPGVTIDNDNNISLRGQQGVLVMINGKNQFLRGDELIGILESMPAENIKNIEIITNPSSKYDAEGNSGIINIQLKKNTNLGMNGSLSIGARHGQRFSNNVSLDLNYRSEKINIYGSGSYSGWAGFQDINLLRQIPFNNGITTFSQTSDMLNDRINFSGKIGADYTLSSKTTLGVLYKSNIGSNDFLLKIIKRIIFNYQTFVLKIHLCDFH